MAKILIATLYVFEPIIASSTKISADRLILLIDKQPDEKQQKSLDIIKQSLGSVLEIKTVKTDVYDIVEVARESVKIIDLLSDKDEIYIDITAGRKTKALGLLFGAYARSTRIKRIMYVKEEKAVIWRGHMIMKAIDQFLHDVDWGDLDVLVVDLGRILEIQGEE